MMPKCMSRGKASSAAEGMNDFVRFVIARGSGFVVRAKPESFIQVDNEEGAELVEFAFSASILFLLVFGLMELCIALFMYNTAAEAARETTRWASVRGSTCSNPNITACPATLAQVQSYGKNLVGASAMTVQAWWCNADGVTNCVQSPTNAHMGNIIKVKVSYTFSSIPFVTKSALAVSSTSEAVIWQ